MTRWLLLVLCTTWALLAGAEGFESGFLSSWQIPGRNMAGTPLPAGAVIRLADAVRGEPVFAGRFALRVEADDKQVTVSPIGRLALDDAPSGYWVVEGRIRVERGQLFTNSYHFNSDGSYVGEKQFFFNPAPGWQHFRVVVGPPGSAADIPLSKGAVSFAWPLNVYPKSLVFFDDFSITPLATNIIRVTDPGWKRADGKASYTVTVALAEANLRPDPAIAGYGSTWKPEADPPPTATTPQAGVRVVLRADRQGLEQITPPVATTGADGTATFTVRATRAGTVNLRAYTPAPPGKPYGEMLTPTPAVLTWAEPGTTVSIEDFTGHHWQNELVCYRMAWPRGAANPVSVRVKDAAGVICVSQLDEVQTHPDGSIASALVCWMADLPALGTANYSVVTKGMTATAGEALPKADLTVQRGDITEIRTAGIGIRIPMKALKFAAPATANIPGPLLAVRGRSGAWLGRGWLEHPGGVYSMTPTLRAAGPLFADYHVEYELTNGRYHADVRVIAGSPVALVTEEYDTGVGAFKFSLYDGLQPDTGRWRGHSGSPDFAPGYTIGFGSGREAVSPLKYDREGNIFSLAGWMSWWPNSGQYWGVYNSKNPQSDYLGLFRIRSGQWRNPTWPGVEMSAKPDLVAVFALGAGKRRWGLYSGTAAEAIPTPDAEPSKGTDIGNGKAVWNNGAPERTNTARATLNRLMIQYGEMPLDKYKDWIFDWPGADADTYPRQFIVPGTLEAVRQRAQAYGPIKDRLGLQSYKYIAYPITGDEKIGRDIYDGFNGGDYNWTGQINRMRSDVMNWLEGEGDTGAAMHNLHGQAKIRYNALRYDTAASVKSLTPAERRQLRALMAFEAQKAADLDWVPFGTGFHLGNPNMPTAVAATIGVCGAALPSHPYAQEWMDRAYRYLRDTVVSFTAPEGAWNECPHYQMDASIQQIMQLGLALKNAGYADLYREPKLQAAMRYAAEIWTPVDARTGYRVMPSIGNGGLESTSLFGWMATGLRDIDPDAAALQQWMWKESGALLMYPYDELVIDPTAPAKAPNFTSRNFPGFGAILRSGAPAPNETYMAFRAGYWQSHYEPGDQGEMVLYAKGAPLCLDFASQYAPTVGRPYMHNRVSFDHKYSLDNGSMNLFAASAGADYARSRVSTTTLMTLPETPEQEDQLRKEGKLLPNTMPPTTTVPKIEWDRQVLFAKDPDPLAPNYFVVRDSFSGNTTLPSDWNLWTLSNTVTWEGNHAVAAAQFGGVLLDVFMLDPVTPAWITGEWAHNFLPGMTAVTPWKKQNPGKPWEERQRLLRVKQGPGNGYLAVLYPRLTTEAAPAVTPLAEGKAVKVVHPQGTDVLFLTPAVAEVRAEGLSFQGTAAAVRKRKTTLTLALLDGTGLAVDGAYMLTQQPGGTLTLTATTKELTLTSDGKARLIEITPPAAWLAAPLPAPSPFTLKERKATSWVLQAPAGKATVTLTQP